MGRRQLLALWESVQNRTTTAWPPGKALEHVVLRAFELEGANVVWPFRVPVGDRTLEQIDGAVYAEGLSCLIECKDQIENVNFEPIAKLRQQLARRPPSTIGCCVASNGFTREAVDLAQRSSPQNVLLWFGDEIDFALKNRRMVRGLVAKYRHCVERALPDLKINLSHDGIRLRNR